MSAPVSGREGVVGKRLVVVGVKWPPETFIARRLRGLSHAGFDVTVLGPASADAGPRPDEPLTVRSTGLRSGAIAGLRASLRQPSWLVGAAGLLRDARPAAGLRRLAIDSQLTALAPDVVHFEWIAAAIEALPLIRRWRWPLVVSCRGAQINVRPHLPGADAYVAGLREVFARADAVHCVSRAILDEAVPFGLDPAKARVITPAVPHEEFVPRRERAGDGPFEVISIGTLEWRKANELALVAFRRLLDRGVDARYTLVGDGPDRRRVLYTIRDLGLTERVRWLGRQPPDQVRAHLQRADALLLTSHSEGIANVVLEAMACGVAVVTTDAGGMREAVRDGVDGLVVPIRDAEAAARALVTLAADGDLRARMGAAARARIVGAFTLDQQIARFVDLYADVLSRSSR
jgi:glycosyltransferase involved in cell wall biosynthesis